VTKQLREIHLVVLVIVSGGVILSGTSEQNVTALDDVLYGYFTGRDCSGGKESSLALLAPLAALTLDLPHPATVMLPECRAKFPEPICVQSARLRPCDVLLQMRQASGADDRT
jgi:hypothetical protein